MLKRTAAVLWILGALVPTPVAAQSVYLNAADFPSIQAAVDALGDAGGVVWIPPGTYDTTTTPSFRPPLRFPKYVNDSERHIVHVTGAGPYATILRGMSAASADSNMCEIQATNQQLSNLALLSFAAPGTGKGSGIRIASGHKEVTDSVLAGIRVDNVQIYNAARWGVYVSGPSGVNDGWSIVNTFNNLQIVSGCDSAAVFIGTNCTTQSFSNSYFNGFRGHGALIRGDGQSFRNCAFESGESNSAFALVDTAANISFEQCWFEDHRATGGYDWFVRATEKSNGLNLTGCAFFRPERAQVRALWLDRWVYGAQVVGGTFTAKDNPSGTFDSRHQITVRGYVTAQGVQNWNRVALVVTGGVTRTSAAYYIQSVTDSLLSGESPQPGIQLLNERGLRLPRYLQTDLPAVTSKDEGLLAYQRSDSSLVMVRPNGTWESLSPEASVMLPAFQMRPRNGTNTVTDAGTYPNRFTYVNWSGSSSARDGMGVEWRVPDETVPGTTVQFTVVWSYSQDLTTDYNWVCELNALKASEGAVLTASGTTTTNVLDTDRQSVNAMFDDSVGTVTDVRPGQLLRLNICRNKTNGSDTYPYDIRFIGLQIRYRSR